MSVPKINKEDILNFIKAGGFYIGNLAFEVYGEILNKIGEQAFDAVIEIGITNTIAALYDAKVDDKEILRVVNEHWGLDKNNIEDRIIWEKKEATIRSLEQHLRLQG